MRASIKDYKVNYEYRESLLQEFNGVGIKKQYSKNEIIEEGFTKLEYCYIISHGIVKQSFIGFNGKEKTFLLLSKGDLFGEVTLIQGDYNQVITKSLTSVTVSMIRKDIFYKTLEKSPKLYKDILLMLTTKFRILLSQLHDGFFFTTEEKLYCLLKRLSIQHGSKTPEGILITLRLTHEELANMLGSTRSTITRIILKFEKESLVRRLGQYIVFMD